MKMVMSRRIIGLILSFLFVVSILPMGVLAAEEVEHPKRDWTGYTPISSSKDLLAIKDNPYGKYYLTRDIDLLYYTSYNGGNWSPIGGGYCKLDISSAEEFSDALYSYGTLYCYDSQNEIYFDVVDYTIGEEYYYLDAFYGVLEGNGYVIKDIYGDQHGWGATAYGGIFGYNLGIIHDITIDGAFFTSKEANGGIAGVNYGIISDCKVTRGRIGYVPYEGVSSFSGGICGINYGYISGCYNGGVVSTTQYLGGIAGLNCGIIRNCTSDAIIDGFFASGGICGGSYGGVIIDCISSPGPRLLQDYVRGTVGAIVGYDLSDEENSSYYNNCFYSEAGYVQVAVGNISDSNLKGGKVTVKKFSKAENNASYFSKYLDFENEWYEVSTGDIRPTGSRSYDTTESSAIWKGNVVNKFEWGHGTGTKEDPYIVSVAAQLAYISKCVAEGNTFKDTYFIVKNDIAFNDMSVPYWYVNAIEFSPIGGEEYAFEGCFEGNGHTISGLYIDRPHSSYLGLFGHIAGEAVIKNLNVTGYIKGYSDTGMVCGINDGAVIKDCSSDGYIDSYMFSGMVCGENGGILKACSAEGKLVGGIGLGGICGYNYADISLCRSNTDILSFSYGVAGIVSVNDGNVKNSYNTGTVEAMEMAAGVCFENIGKISNCYNAGKITGWDFLGAVCGISDTENIKDCYYLANSATTYDGTVGKGICISFEGDSVNDIDSVTNSLSVQEMQRESSFGKYDFSAVWTMNGTDDYSYPELKRLFALPNFDVNGDGAVNSKDSNLLKRYLSGSSADIDIYNSDINFDETIDAKDSNLLKYKLAGN